VRNYNNYNYNNQSRLGNFMKNMADRKYFLAAERKCSVKRQEKRVR